MNDTIPSRPPLFKGQRAKQYTIMSIKEYNATRLLFKASVIEPLQDMDVFSIHTPEGTYSMSKADFYRVFRNVTLSASYKWKGIYHYPTTPSKALQFLK